VPGKRFASNRRLQPAGVAAVSKRARHRGLERRQAETVSEIGADENSFLSLVNGLVRSRPRLMVAMAGMLHLSPICGVASLWQPAGRCVWYEWIRPL